MTHWQFKAHVLQPSDTGQTCTVCGRSWSYRWQPLGGGHSALSDCLAVIATLEEMAEMEVENV